MTRLWARLREIWLIWLDDAVAWAEVASGLTLIMLRGAVLLWGPTLGVPWEVADRLQSVGITEGSWGTYLMVCGVLQVWYAGQRQARGRRWVTMAILLGFVVMTGAFLVNPPGIVNASLLCLTAFYTALLYRVFRSRPPTAGVEDG